MSRKLDNLIRVLNELKDRYGEADPVVSQLQCELDAQIASELRYPANPSFDSEETAKSKTSRPNEELFKNSNPFKKNAAVSRFLSLN